MTKKEFEKYKFSVNTEVKVKDMKGWCPVVYVDFEDCGIGVFRHDYAVQRFIPYDEIINIRQKDRL